MWILNPSSKQFKSILYKGLSSLLSVAIVFTTSDFLQAASLPSTPVPVVNLGTFTLPGNLGMISDAYRSGNDKRLDLLSSIFTLPYKKEFEIFWTSSLNSRNYNRHAWWV